MIGILVREKKLTVTEPAPIAAWSGPSDPRHAITIDQLLRMTSDLDIGRSLEANFYGAFDPFAQMVFRESDMAAFAQRAPLGTSPGEKWKYTNGNTLLLSGIVRDQVCGDDASVYAFAHRELFDKLGMQHVTLEFDGAGTPIGASHMWAPARAWARFGMLYFDDGVVGGERILPAGWVDYWATLTAVSGGYGYGAGFWTNRGDSKGGKRRAQRAMPADSFMARGSQGQYIVIIPSQHLVIARFGISYTPYGDLDGMNRLVTDVVDAVKRR